MPYYTPSIKTRRRRDAFLARAGMRRVSAGPVLTRPRSAALRIALAGTENKYLDSYKGATTLGTSVTGAEFDPNTVLCLNSVVQGDTEINRDGRQIVATGIDIRGELTTTTLTSQTGVTGAVTVRVLLIQDKETNESQLSSEKVLQDPPGGEAVFAFRNMKYKSRFNILSDRTYVLDATVADDNLTPGSVSQAGQTKTFHISQKLGFKVNYDGELNTVADISDNSLHVIALCSEADRAKIAYQSRFTFAG